MNFISESYDIKFLYNINDVNNLVSIFKYGLLSKNEKIKRCISSVDLSNADVQKIRDDKRIPNHGMLHDYANLYFNPRNPMMYYLVNHKNLDNLCIICVDKRVLNLHGTVVSDRNAASELAAFESPDKGKRYINFSKVFSEYWTNNNPSKQYENKQIQCAEVLVLNKVPREYLIGVFVCTQKAKEKVEALNLKIQVVINKKLFFQ